jgi:AAA15 family ATPase/GTPase
MEEMLISFRAKNWKSFHSLEFSAVASKEQRHKDRIAVISRPKVRLLPISTIYGGNASGKSNFFEAIAFAQKYVVDGVKPFQSIGVKPFALDLESSKKPTSFEFEIFAENKAYRYSFEVTRSEVLTESLTEILQTVERPMFKRRGREITLEGKFVGNERLRYAGTGTQDNLLFLTNSVHQKCKEFLPVYNWFQKNLLLIAPNASCNTFEMYANDRRPFPLQNQEALDAFDVGIEKIDTIEVPLNQLPSQVNVVVQKESDNLPETATLRIGPYLVGKKEGKLTVHKMVAVHSLEGAPEKKMYFELPDESNGTRRLLDLLPTFAFLKDPRQQRVVFIDELDRSLHHLLTRKLIEDYLDSCSAETRSQLFFTTHDALLMDQTLLRRDELWLVEKNGASSSLCSIGDFKIRHDKSLVSAYLYGRFGGVPSLTRR